MFTSFSLKRTPHGRFFALVLLALCSLLVACGSVSLAPETQARGAACPSTSQLQGAGSTFDAPLFASMFQAYAKTSCGLTVSYLGGGSGAGINGLLEGSVDFGATDIPLTTAALARSQHGPILHIPVTLGAEAIIYHVPGVSSHLKLSGSVLSQIFLGKIAFWNDPAIAALNPGVSLPSVGIMVIHRSDGSGTTGIFTAYLSQISSEWKAKVGSSVSVPWPVGIGERGNGGVADGVQSTVGAIGYVELSYALRLHLLYAQLQNAAGQWVVPSIQGAQAAAFNAPSPPTDLRFFIVNEAGSETYPISGFSWVIVYQHQNDASKGQALARLLWWMIHDGQQYAEPLHYAALPVPMVSRSEAQIRLMTCGSTQTACYQG